MIQIQNNHFSSPAGGTTRLDGSRGPVSDPEEAHKAAGFSTAGKRFAFPAERREVASGARTVFENPGFADPQVHDPAFIYQIVGN